MFYNFISHTPGGICFTDTHTHTHTHTHCRLGVTKAKKHLLAINCLHTSGPTICGKDLPSSLTLNVWVDIMLQTPPPRTRPATYNKLLHVASSHLNSSSRHVLTCSAPSYSPHRIRNGQLTLAHILRALFRCFFLHPILWVCNYLLHRSGRNFSTFLVREWWHPD